MISFSSEPVRESVVEFRVVKNDMIFFLLSRERSG